MAGYIDPFDRPAAAETLGYVDPFDPAPEKKSSGVLRQLADIPVGLVSGVAGLTNAAVGLGDIATGGKVGGVINTVGSVADQVGVPTYLRPTQWRDQIQSLYSPEMQSSKEAAHQASVDAEEQAKREGAGPWEQIGAGALGALKGIIQNPRSGMAFVTENYGGMKAIAKGTEKVLARYLPEIDAAVKSGAMTQAQADAQIAKIAGYASPAGEGVLTMGQNAEQLRAEKPDATAGDYLLQVPAGMITGAIAHGVGRIPGLENAETTMALNAMGRKSGFTGGMASRVGKGVLSEGVLQEVPQSAQEQVWQNLAEGKPWQEGIGEQAVQGLVAGGAMGGGAAGMSALARPASSAAQGSTPETATRPAGPLQGAVASGIASGAIAPVPTPGAPETAIPASLPAPADVPRLGYSPEVSETRQAPIIVDAQGNAIHDFGSQTGRLIVDADGTIRPQSEADARLIDARAQQLSDFGLTSDVIRAQIMRESLPQNTFAAPELPVAPAASPLDQQAESAGVPSPTVTRTQGVPEHGHETQITEPAAPGREAQPATVADAGVSAPPVSARVATLVAKSSDDQLTKLASSSNTAIRGAALEEVGRRAAGVSPETVAQPVVETEPEPTADSPTPQEQKPEAGNALRAKAAQLREAAVLAVGRQKDRLTTLADRLESSAAKIRDATVAEAAAAERANFIRTVNRKESTGWRGINYSNGDGMLLVSADGKKAVEFRSRNLQSGADALRAQAAAQAFAIDNPYLAGESAPPMELRGQTPAEIAASEAKSKAAAEADAKAAQAEEKARKDAAEREEIKKHSEAAAAEFQLGQDALDNLSGQKSLLDSSPAAERVQRSSEKWANEGKSDADLAEEKASLIGEELGGQFIEAALGGDDFVLSDLPIAVKQWAEDSNVPSDTLRQSVLKKVESSDLSASKKRAIRNALDPTKSDTKTNPQPESKIEDFGEKIGGARKDLWTSFADRLRDAGQLDVASEPLSKYWPAPDYQALIDGGADASAVALLRAMRDAIPSKPRLSNKLKRWADLAHRLRGTATGMLSGELPVNRARAVISTLAERSRALRGILDQAELYALVGHAKSLDGVRISSGEYSVFNGERFNPARVIWAVEKDAAATAFSNWPRMLATGDTRAKALANFQAKYAEMEIQKPAAREVTFEVYSRDGQFYVGKRIGSNVAQLSDLFGSVKEARAYRESHQEAMVDKLAKFKEIPNERRDTNAPRVGEDRRGGKDVTPEMFGDSFGFRGVEFGNWVEQGKRQADLNDAYDALMDLAAIIGIPPRALSLNGQLGLAFGARGSGGVHPASAHYEPDKVVINLTKKSGAGSLGHEWWHAVDNYFSRMRKKPAAFMTEAPEVSLAGQNAPFESHGAVRREMIEAFGSVLRAIRSTAIKARASKLDAKRTKAYWTIAPEMSARAFESYLISKLQDANASNDYLANIVDEATWKAAEALGFELEGSYPYPTAGEVPAIREAFDRFFQTVQTKDGEAGNVMLFNQSAVSKATPADRAVYAMAQEGKTAAEILSFIRSASRSKFNRVLAGHLARIGVNPTITLDSQGGWQFGNTSRAPKYAAAYNPKTDTVSLFTPRSAERHALHEFVHAATLKALAKGGPAALQMRALFARLQRKRVLEGQYGGTSIDEFVAEAFTNPGFQRLLMDTPAPATSNLRSAWDWFVRAVSRLLGLHPEQDTALSKALDLGQALMRENVGEARGGPAYALAWHGTPHVWESEPGFPHGRPRLDKMGTGEGAQAYGWGWYSADAEQVGKSYRNAGRSDLDLYEPTPEATAEFNRLYPSGSAVFGRLHGVNSASLATWLKSKTGLADEIRASVPKHLIELYAKSKEKGALYHLDIPDAVMPHLLDWDKPLSEQSPAVRKALAGQSEKVTADEIYRSLVKDGDPNQKMLDGSTLGEWAREYANREAYTKKGAHFYAELSGSLGGDRKASEHLASLGIVGTRYMDEHSRNRTPLVVSPVKTFDGKTLWTVKGLPMPSEFKSRDAAQKFADQQAAGIPQPTHNYVIWDQPTLDKISLLERNGEKLDAIREADEAVRYSQAGLPDTITVDGVDRPTTNSEGLPIHYTEEGIRNFWRWIDGIQRAGVDSQGAASSRRGNAQGASETASRYLFDEQGRPRVFYHGTSDDVKAFNLTHRNRKDHGWLGRGVYLTDDHLLAETYANLKGGYQDQTVMPLYAALRNPYVYSLEEKRKLSRASESVISAFTDRAIALGYDGGVLEFGNGSIEVVVFNPEAVKSAIGNTGAFSPMNQDIRYNLASDWIDHSAVRSIAANAMHSDKATSWLTPFNTQYHKAEKWAQEGKTGFKRVFDMGQKFLSDVSRFAITAQNEAPTLFHEIRSLADARESLKNLRSIGALTGRERKADIEAIANPLYEGTLYGGGSPTSGVIFSDAKLRADYHLTNRQIKLYREALAAVNASLDEMAKSVIAKHAKANQVEFNADWSIDDMSDGVIEGLKDRKADLEYSVGREEQERIEANIADLQEMDKPEEAESLRRQFEKTRSDAVKALDRLDKTIADVRGIVAKNQALQDHGYFPLMRFGKHTVTAKDKDGKLQFFGMYEGHPLIPRSGQVQSNQVAAAIRAEHPDWTVTTGIKNSEEYKLYDGLNLEALQLFADHMDAESLEPYQEFFRQATNDRSVMKRLIHRQGTPGFDRDVRRTLSQFILSNARHTSSNYHMSDMLKAARDAGQDGGDIGAEAVRLQQYIAQPQEEAHALRGFLFFNFLGGSIASAMVNLSQVPMMTFPYLTRYEGAAALGKRLLVAARMAVGDVSDVGGALGKALQRAEADGVTAPQEVHQMTATAANQIFSGSRGVGLLLRAWGAPFALAESFNRRTTFIAAFQIAEGMTDAQLAAAGVKDAFGFAEKSVTDTQGIYNKGNRPNAGRGAVGATIMTFKQFSIMYLELLRRMPVRQQLLMLGVLALAAGAGGLPFVEDAEDLIDTFGQWLGYGTNSKKWVRNRMTDAFGTGGADVLMNGVLSQMGIDLHSRFGMQNLLPGSGALKQSSVDKGRDAAEFFGPAASVLQNAATALQELATGHADRAALALAPNAAQNAVKGLKMAGTGYAEDAKGRRTVPVNVGEAFAKGVGFNPKSVADFGEIKRGLAQDQRMLQVKREEFTSAMADAILSGDTEARQKAMAEVRQWNQDNPEMRVAINPATVAQRVRAARQQGAERFLKTVSRPMREAARKELLPQ